MYTQCHSEKKVTDKIDFIQKQDLTEPCIHNEYKRTIPLGKSVRFMIDHVSFHIIIKPENNK